MQSPHSNHIIVGIAGGTASGKSYFTELIYDAAEEHELAIIQTDSYYLSNHGLSKEERDQINYDHPKQVEFNLLLEHLQQLASGAEIQIPHYDFANHQRTDSTTPLHPKPIIIVEGILALHVKELRTLYDYSIFIDAPLPLRKERRMSRDLRERGRSPESIEQQWISTVQPMHELYCEPSKEFADIVLDGGSLGASEAQRELGIIRNFLSEKS